MEIVVFIGNDARNCHAQREKRHIVASVKREFRNFAAYLYAAITIQSQTKMLHKYWKQQNKSAQWP